MPTHVEIIILSRDNSPIAGEVSDAIDAQISIVPHVHRVIGTPRQDDAHRWQTIARARNEGKKLGASPWLMFVDDDVVLAPDCVARLLQALQSRMEFAAFAADYNDEMRAGRGHWDYPRHVGMGATLFRRPQLEIVKFRWENNRCECQCCCDDLRKSGYGVGYVPGALAWHKPALAARVLGSHGNDGPSADDSRPPGCILAAFDRFHFQKFQRQFLRTLRAAGNNEQVTAVTYGLRPGELGRLSSLRNVEVFPNHNPRDHPSIARIRDFQRVISGWQGNTPVAYWDAGDVLFQGPIADLWDLVRAYPDELLVVQEPFGYPENPAIADWTSSIRDVGARRHAFELMSTNPFLNGGFVAASAQTMLRYLVEAQRLMESAATAGLGFGSDQVALNLYCYSNLGSWRVIPEGWNYCLAGRNPSEFRIRRNGHTSAGSRCPVHVVHGNAGTLREVEWYYKFLSLAATS
jgi:hypothetical protein